MKHIKEIEKQIESLEFAKTYAKSSNEMISIQFEINRLVNKLNKEQ